MTEFIKNNYKILIGIIFGLILVVLLMGCEKNNHKTIINTVGPIDSVYTPIKLNDTIDSI